MTSGLTAVRFLSWLRAWPLTGTPGRVPMRLTKNRMPMFIAQIPNDIAIKRPVIDRRIAIRMEGFPG